MTGIWVVNAKRWPISVALIGAMGLAACDENGEFAFPAAQSGAATASAPLPANALNQRVQRDIDIERPEIFSVRDDGLWDGRPSLGGVWVAHPDVVDPERVVIRNTETGQSIVGALFRRERENPGPLLQVSSDAADALDILPGAPTLLEVVALRREEVVEDAAEAPAENAVVASLATPVTVEATPLDDAAPATEDDATIAPAAAATAAVVLPPALEAATAAAEQSTAAAAAVATETAQAVADTSETVDVSAVLAPAPLPQGAQAQIGVFSIEGNANSAAQSIIASGIEATVAPQEVGGRTVWRVVAGPVTDTGDITRLREMGFVDAFVIEDAQ